ncbi:MAG: hypothetical protein C7B47_05690 [Sulfobacillus thermosulfidooxidans]|uniref:Uncharacterized protein n=1 Tax=Sulfobacillus thermosulfidooxidans TaxID=28034 RepID=A0A2T2X131_SULTH|nr:MAG: hypothetical protein C7B47_05690 [Sulfobacillus thermosulfidooxidans]
MIMFGLVIISTTLLLLVLAGPSVLALSPATYPYLTLSHVFSFLFSVLIFVIFGREMKKRGHRPIWPGVLLGAFTAFASSLVYQYTIRLPQAQMALIRQLHGVPAQAVITMLHLHMISGAVITALFAAGFYGLLGGFASWWGGWPIKGSPPNPANKSEPESRVS